MVSQLLCLQCYCFVLKTVMYTIWVYPQWLWIHGQQYSIILSLLFVAVHVLLGIMADHLPDPYVPVPWILDSSWTPTCIPINDRPGCDPINLMVISKHQSSVVARTGQTILVWLLATQVKVFSWFGWEEIFRGASLLTNKETSSSSSWNPVFSSCLHFQVSQSMLPLLFL